MTHQTIASETFGTNPEPSTVRFERTLPGPIERVWSYLTDPDKRRLWLAAGPMDLRSGGRMELHFHNRTLCDEAVPVQFQKYAGEITSRHTVLRCEPPHALAFTWDEDGDASEVLMELATEGDDVRLVVTHSRLSPNARNLVSGGWHSHLDLLESRLRGEANAPFWSTLAQVSAVYAARGAKASA